MAYIISEITSYDNKRNKVTLDYGEVTFLLYKGECRKLGIPADNADRSCKKHSESDNHASKSCGFGKSVESLKPGRWSEIEDCSDDPTEDGSSYDLQGGRSYMRDDRQEHERSERALTDSQYRYIMDEILLPRAKKRVLYYLKSADKTRDQIRRKLREGFYPDEVIEGVFAFLDKYGFADDANYAEQYAEELKHSHSAKEIAQKLAQKGISREQIAIQLEELEPEDEYAACRKALARKYPRGLVTAGNDVAAENAFSDDDYDIDGRLTDNTSTEEEYINTDGSYDRKQNMLRSCSFKNSRRAGGLSRRTSETDRAYAYLARKGFAYDIIKQVISEACKNQENE